jgi:hypothetical protein
MKIIAAVSIGRNGRQYKAGDSLDVSPSHARMYVLSKQARYETGMVKPAETVRKSPAPSVDKKPAAPEPKPAPREQEEKTQRDTQQEEKPRKGRHRRRDMRAEGDGE